MTSYAPQKLLLLFLLLAMGHVACGSTISTDQASNWLTQKTNHPPAINLTGKWNAGAALGGGWGEGDFIQHGAQLKGTLGLYWIRGVVTSDWVYLAIISRRRVYYTARLRIMPDGRLEGEAVKGDIVDSATGQSANAYRIAMSRMQ